MGKQRTDLITSATTDQKARWWCEINRRGWPAEWGCEMPSPAVIRVVMDRLRSDVGEKALFREWNRDRMDDAQFEKWWATEALGLEAPE